MLAPLLLFALPLKGEENRLHFHLDLICPESQELTDFSQAIPKQSGEEEAYEKWKASIIHQMHLLEALLESGYISNGVCRAEVSTPPGDSP